MPILYLTEIVCAIFGLIVIITQIIMPFFSGMPIFPALQRHGIEAKLEQAKQDVRIAALEITLADLKRQADEIRQPKEGK